MNAGLIEKPTDLKEIKPSQTLLLKIVSKADFVRHYDYGGVGHEYSAYDDEKRGWYFTKVAQKIMLRKITWRIGPIWTKMK